MADPFAAALSTLHSAAGSVAATYATPGGAAVPLRVIRSQATSGASLGRSDLLMDGDVFEIQRCDLVGRPARGATLTIGTETFILSAGAKLDVEGLTWICPAEPS